MSVHTEIHLETEICDHLAAHGWLYEAGDAARHHTRPRSRSAERAMPQPDPAPPGTSADSSAVLARAFLDAARDAVAFLAREPEFHADAQVSVLTAQGTITPARPDDVVGWFWAHVRFATARVAGELAYGDRELVMSATVGPVRGRGEAPGEASAGSISSPPALAMPRAPRTVPRPRRAPYACPPPAAPAICAIHASPACCISSGDISFMRVASPHSWPDGSATLPYRSPQKASSSG